ncbi:MAG TPA: phosphotransferase [Chloroflexi bacterium]|nr:phosphotransferase [Chloroflexota bacterium]
MTTDKLLKHLTNTAIPTVAPIEIVDAQDISTWQHDTMTFTGVWSARKRSQKLMLRQYLGRISYWQTQDPYQADRVWAVMRRLRLDGFPAPRPVARGLFGETPYLIWRQPRGQVWTPGKASQAGSDGGNLPPLFKSNEIQPNDFDAQIDALIPQLAKLLARLHALNHNGLNNEPLYQATVAGTLVRMLLWGREMGNEELRRAVRQLKPAVVKIQSWPHRLIHGDPYLGNILIRDKKIAALLNWENAAIGDPRWDVMTAAHHLHQFSPSQADELVNSYEKISGKRIANRPFWYAMIAVRLYALKSWVARALEMGSLSPRHAKWTQDLAAVRESAFAYLDEAGL